MSDNTISLAEAAVSAQTNLEIIQHYIRIGLIGEGSGNVNKHAVYDRSIVERLRFIQRAKDLGFSLPEIRELLQLDYSQCDDAKRIAENKLNLVRKKIEDLQAIEKVLSGLVGCCSSVDSGGACELIQLLGKDHN